MRHPPFEIARYSKLRRSGCRRTEYPSGSSEAMASPSKPAFSADDKAEAVVLEARPLKLPGLIPDRTCRPHDSSPTTGMYGIDPVASPRSLEE